MSDRERVFIVIRGGARAGRLQTLARWVRRLVPAAVLLVGSAVLPANLDPGAVVITVDADDVASGPLSLADALTRHRAPPRDRA